MARDNEHSGAWSAVGGVLLTVFGTIATGQSNDVAQPVLTLLLAGAVVGLYIMLAPLLRWFPFAAKKPMASWASAPSRAAIVVRGANNVVTRNRVHGFDHGIDISGEDTTIEENVVTAAGSDLRQALQQQLDRAIDLQNRLSGPLSVTLAALTGTPTTQADIDNWIFQTEVLLGHEPKRLAIFRAPRHLSPTGAVIASALQTPLQRELDQRIRQLEEVIKGLP